jgi:hypothetical protein
MVSLVQQELPTLLGGITSAAGNTYPSGHWSSPFTSAAGTTYPSGAPEFTLHWCSRNYLPFWGTGFHPSLVQQELPTLHRSSPLGFLLWGLCYSVFFFVVYWRSLFFLQEIIVCPFAIVLDVLRYLITPLFRYVHFFINIARSIPQQMDC